MGHTPIKPKRLSQKLLQIREGLGLSQNGLISHLGLTAQLSQGKISEFETGRREPSLLVLLKYARGAGVAMELLVDDELDLPRSLRGGKPVKQTSGRKAQKGQSIYNRRDKSTKSGVQKRSPGRAAQ